MRGRYGRFVRRRLWPSPVRAPANPVRVHSRYCIGQQRYRYRCRGAARRE